MSPDAFIQFRVTPEVKTLLRALAQREQISESALVHQTNPVIFVQPHADARFATRLFRLESSRQTSLRRCYAPNR